MLRVFVPITRSRGACGLVTAARAQCRASQPPAAGPIRALRYYADSRTPDKTVLPGSNSSEVAGVPQPPILTSPAGPSGASDAPYSSTINSSTHIPPENAPKLPEAPEAATAPPSAQQTTPPTTGIPPPTASAPSSPPPPPPKPKKRRRFRRFLLYTTTLLGIGYAGGVYFALVNDDFHDFFTDYVPGGEDAVLFFEEREFKRRFPDGRAGSRLYPQVSGEKKVTISGRSGMAARPAETKNVKETGKGASTDPNLGSKDRAVGQPVTSQPSTSESPAPGKDAASKDSERVQRAKERTPDSPTKPQSAQAQKEKPAEEKKPEPKTSPTAGAAAPAAPVAQIDPLSLPGATDPSVQKVANMLNDLITVVNADNASSKYSSTLNKAKEDIQQVASEMASYRENQQSAAREQLKKNDAEFDRVAKELVSRAQQEQKEQELRWREEYEQERQRLAESYDSKLKAELDAAHNVAEQKLQNELLQQNIKLQDSFADSIRNQVETERDSRLSKLTELSTTVSELEKLTTQWNGVVDANLKAQHLVVAVDAVRSKLEDADRPTPFLHELAALKETSNQNGTVNAAIASIRPAAYQKGIPTLGQLIDRFRRVASEVRKASLLPEDAGVASHAASFVLSKVLFKKQGLTAGEDVESILTRTATLLEEGDLDEAAREMNGLTGWARVLSDDWLTDCRRVLEVRQAIEVMSTEAKLQSLMVE